MEWFGDQVPRLMATIRSQPGMVAAASGRPRNSFFRNSCPKLAEKAIPCCLLVCGEPVTNRRCHPKTQEAESERALCWLRCVGSAVLAPVHERRNSVLEYDCFRNSNRACLPEKWGHGRPVVAREGRVCTIRPCSTARVGAKATRTGAALREVWYFHEPSNVKYLWTHPVAR